MPWLGRAVTHACRGRVRGSPRADVGRKDAPAPLTSSREVSVGACPGAQAQGTKIGPLQAAHLGRMAAHEGAWGLGRLTLGRGANKPQRETPSRGGGAGRENSLACQGWDLPRCEASVRLARA